MSLSLKAELEIWAAALKAYDGQDFGKALDLFSRIADSSKILTNMGLIYATIGKHETAVEHFVAATNLDSYLAIAHFQCGVSNFLLQRYDFALLNFEDAYLYLRGNEAINYDQLGLKFKLFSVEVLFNKGLSQLNLGYAEEGIADMQEASRLKVTEEHNVIDEAIRDRAEGYTVFSIPVGVLYRPSENKLKNSKSKDYLGKAKLVAARYSNDAFTEFTGVMKLKQASGENAENGDKPAVESSVLSRSATVPPPRINPIALLPTVLERSKTTLQHRVGVRPDAATILASQQTQSISNPANALSLSESDLLNSRSNTVLGRGNTSPVVEGPAAKAGVMPLRVKTPQSASGSVAGISADDSKAGEETGAVPGRGPTTIRSRPSLRRPRGQGAIQPPSQTVHLDQHMNATKGVTSLMSPTAPVLVQEGHLTQFYNAYMDVYTDDQALRMTTPRPPTIQTQSDSSSSQRQLPAGLSYQQPQLQLQEQQQFPAWMQSNTSASSGMGCAPSKAANACMRMQMESIADMTQNMGIDMGNANMSKGVTKNTCAGTVRRKVVHRPTVRRVTYDQDSDGGFVMGEYEESEMANIRVKLHYQGDVRGMAIPSIMSFNEFVERVTAKFGTSLTGLGMKFTDEDGTKISLRDESDFELAIETARENAKGRSEGKIEVWCVDV